MFSRLLHRLLQPVSHQGNSGGFGMRNHSSYRHHGVSHATCRRWRLGGEEDERCRGVDIMNFLMSVSILVIRIRVHVVIFLSTSMTGSLPVDRNVDRVIIQSLRSASRRMRENYNIPMTGSMSVWGDMFPFSCSHLGRRFLPRRD